MNLYLVWNGWEPESIECLFSGSLETWSCTAIYRYCKISRNSLMSHWVIREGPGLNFYPSQVAQSVASPVSHSEVRGSNLPRVWQKVEKAETEYYTNVHVSSVETLWKRSNKFRNQPILLFVLFYFVIWLYNLYELSCKILGLLVKKWLIWPVDPWFCTHLFNSG